MLMCIEEQHGAVCVKNILRAIAVMDVPIRNQNFADAVLLLRIAGANCDVVEKTKSHPARWTGMMPRWTHRAKGVAHRASNHGIDRGQNSARGQQRGVIGILAN